MRFGSGARGFAIKFYDSGEFVHSSLLNLFRSTMLCDNCALFEYCEQLAITWCVYAGYKRGAEAVVVKFNYLRRW